MSNTSTTSMRDHAARVQRERTSGQPTPEDQARQVADDESAQQQTIIGEVVENAADAEGAQILEGPDQPGLRVDQALSLPLLLPVPRGDAARNWVMQNVCVHGTGFSILVGRVAGTCSEFEDRVTEIGGQQVASIALFGEFMMQDYFPGLGMVRTNSELYFPNSYGRAIKNRLKARESADEIVEFDVDIGLEATGKTIPYRWTIIARHRSIMSHRMAALWGNRPTPVSARLAGTVPAKRIGN